MNILGIGGPELILILLVMLIIAGPKRMIQWSYVLGKWVAKFRVMWSQTVDMVQKELDASGVDVKLPKTPPTRKNLVKMVNDAVIPANDPLRKTLDEVKADVDGIDEDLSAVTKSLSSRYTQRPVANLASKKAASANPAQDASAAAMGAWSGTQATNGVNGTHNGTGSPTATASPPTESKFGSWSGASGSASKSSDTSDSDNVDSEGDAS